MVRVDTSESIFKFIKFTGKHMILGFLDMNIL